MSVGDRRGAELFVPGRLCLLGEHSDWAGLRGVHPGSCLVIGTDQGLHATVRAGRDFLVETAVPVPAGGDTVRWRTMRCAWNADALLQAARDQQEFFRYCAGVAHEFRTCHPRAGALELRIDRMDLPLKKGVSSSAAVCVLVAEAFNRVHELGLFPHEIMELAYRGERLTGSQCGRMDQACILGNTPVLLTFAGEADIRVEPVFPRKCISLFFVDLAGRKDTVRILSDLQTSYSTCESLQEGLGPDNEGIIRRAYRALSAGDAEAFGACMTAAQELFDSKVAPCSRQELASPRLHDLLALEAIRPHIYGGKGVGSQGDGTAQFVARSDADRREAMALVERAYPEMRCFPLSVLPAGQGR